jgi:prepilin-type N-terminal cleavage/methylation domain-containing protein
MNKNTGFTLIELLVVVLIIGILAAIALPQYNRSVEKSRAAEALLMTKAISLANDRHFLETGSYSTDLDQLDIEVPGAVSTLAGSNGLNRKTTSLFDFGTRDKLKALGNRLPIATKYYIGISYTNEVVCATYTTSWNYVCESLGGKTGTSTACIAGITCYIIK